MIRLAESFYHGEKIARATQTKLDTKKEKYTKLFKSRWLQQTGREAAHARVEKRSPKSVKITTTPRVKITTP